MLKYDFIDRDIEAERELANRALSHQQRVKELEQRAVMQKRDAVLAAKMDARARIRRIERDSEELRTWNRRKPDLSDEALSNASSFDLFRKQSIFVEDKIRQRLLDEGIDPIEVDSVIAYEADRLAVEAAAAGKHIDSYLNDVAVEAGWDDRHSSAFDRAVSITKQDLKGEFGERADIGSITETREFAQGFLSNLNAQFEMIVGESPPITEMLKQANEENIKASAGETFEVRFDRFKNGAKSDETPG